MIRPGRKVRLALGGEAGDWVFLVLVLAGFALNLYLLFRRVGEGGTAGCGGGPCEQVLASRWSVVFGVPVTVFGALVYLGLIAAPTSWGRRAALPLLGAVLGSVCWFLFVQAVLIGRFYPILRLRSPTSCCWPGKTSPARGWTLPWRTRGLTDSSQRTSPTGCPSRENPENSPSC